MQYLYPKWRLSIYRTTVYRNSGKLIYGSCSRLVCQVFSCNQFYKKWIWSTVAVSGVETSSFFIVVEVGATTPNDTNIFVRGHRMNRVEFGLCARANAFSYAEAQRMKDDYYITL